MFIKVVIAVLLLGFGNARSFEKMVICDFENASELNEWNIGHDGSKAEISSEKVKEGKNALKVYFPEGEGEKFPGIMLSNAPSCTAVGWEEWKLKISSLLPKDMKSYKYFVLDVYNDSSINGMIGVKMMGKDGKVNRKFKDFNLKKKEWQEVKIELSEFLKDVNPVNVKQLEIFMAYLEVPYTVYFDNIRLEK